MKVVPIVWPQIDYSVFIAEASASLGRSTTRSLDEAGLAPDDVKGFLQSLGEFQHAGTAPIPYLRSRECDRALEILSVAFLIESDEKGLLELLKLGHVNVLSSEYAVIIASGTFRQWRELLIEGSHPHTTLSLRQLLTEIIRHFVRGGFGELFCDYDFSGLRDQTIVLIRK